MTRKLPLTASVLCLCGACSCSMHRFADPLAPAPVATQPVRSATKARVRAAQPDTQPAPAGAQRQVNETLAIADAHLAAISRLSPGEAAFANTAGVLDDTLTAVARAAQQLAKVQAATADPAVRQVAADGMQRLEYWVASLEHREDIYGALKSVADTQPQLTESQAQVLEQALQLCSRPLPATAPIAAIASSASEPAVPAASASDSASAVAAAAQAEAITPTVAAPQSAPVFEAPAREAVSPAPVGLVAKVAIEPPYFRADGGLNLSVTAEARGLYCVLGSADLRAWQVVGFATNNFGVARFVDPDASSRSHFFYSAALFKPAPQLAPPVVDSYGRVLLNVVGTEGEVYRLQASLDLLNWQTIGTVTNLNGTASFWDLEATNLYRCFYRAVLP